MPYPFDAAAMFKSSGNITKTGSGTAVKVRGNGLASFTARINIPSFPATYVTHLFRVLAGDNPSTLEILALDERGSGTWTTGGREIEIPFRTSKKYVNVDWIIGATTGGSSLGAVKAGLVPKSAAYDRSVNFETS